MFTNAKTSQGKRSGRLNRLVVMMATGGALLAADLVGLAPIGSFVGVAEARIGHPWTPASGAGVARRTTRRVLRRSTVIVPVLPAGCVRTSVNGVVVWRCGATYYQPYRTGFTVVYLK